MPVASLAAEIAFPYIVDKSHHLAQNLMAFYYTELGGAVYESMREGIDRHDSSHTVGDFARTAIGPATSSRFTSWLDASHDRIISNSSPRSVLALAVRTGSGNGGNHQWIFRLNNSGTSGFGVQMSSVMTTARALCYSSSGFQRVDVAVAAPAVNEWFTIGLSHPGSTGDLKLYWKGAHIGTRASTPAGGIDTPTGLFWAAEEGSNVVVPKLQTVFVMVFDRIIGDAGFRSLGLNPWQMFLPPERVDGFAYSGVPWYEIGGILVEESESSPLVVEKE